MYNNAYIKTSVVNYCSKVTQTKCSSPLLIQSLLSDKYNPDPKEIKVQPWPKSKTYPILILRRLLVRCFNLFNISHTEGDVFIGRGAGRSL